MADFPRQLHALFSQAAPAPVRAPASALQPRVGAPAYPLSPRPLLIISSEIEYKQHDILPTQAAKDSQCRPHALFALVGP